MTNEAIFAVVYVVTLVYGYLGMTWWFRRVLDRREARAMADAHRAAASASTPAEVEGKARGAGRGSRVSAQPEPLGNHADYLYRDSGTFSLRKPRSTRRFLRSYAARIRRQLARGTLKFPKR